MNAPARRRVGALLAVGITISACTSISPEPSFGDPEEAAGALVRGVTAEVTATDTAMAAAGATADFGVEEGLRRVVMRVVDEMSVDVVVVSEADLVLAEPPGLCLVGPFWNPLDAGLSDRCWGTPDLGQLASTSWPTNADGRVVLTAGAPVAFDAPLARGSERCDYAPGEWTFEVALRPVVGGEVFGPLRIPDILLEVPYDPAQPLELLPPGESRVCSYPAAVVLRQGEPELTTE